MTCDRGLINRRATHKPGCGWPDRPLPQPYDCGCRNDSWVAVRIDTTDDTDMAATAASHHGDGTDLGAGDAGAVAGVSTCEIAATCMPGALKHQVHESAAPKAAAPC